MPLSDINMLSSHTISIRVRYTEVDSMEYLHHSRYLQYFEIGRIEMLRSAGLSYAELEHKGIYFAVVKAEIRYKAPARFDDELALTTFLMRQTQVRLEHTYELRLGKTLLAEGSTTIACVGREGELMAIPEEIAEAILSAGKAKE